jgi:hypothetical protein
VDSNSLKSHFPKTIAKLAILIAASLSGRESAKLLL